MTPEEQVVAILGSTTYSEPKPIHVVGTPEATYYTMDTDLQAQLITPLLKQMAVDELEKLRDTLETQNPASAKRTLAVINQVIDEQIGGIV